MILGAMFQNAIIPLGVEGGTRSRAAERIITYRTMDSYKKHLLVWYLGYSPLLNRPNRKKDRLRWKRFLRCPEKTRDKYASRNEQEKIVNAAITLAVIVSPE
jgi:hypothetical protein